MNNDEIAMRVVNRIVRDLSGRRGIGNEWEEIDKQIKKEIKEVWRQHVVQALNNRDELNRKIL